jgi:hypothetical protein
MKFVVLDFFIFMEQLRREPWFRSYDNSEIVFGTMKPSAEIHFALCMTAQNLFSG